MHHAAVRLHHHPKIVPRRREDRIVGRPDDGDLVRVIKAAKQASTVAESTKVFPSERGAPRAALQLDYTPPH